MRVYLDHNATTPVREEVVEAMLPVLREHFGNPSSTHAEGGRARRLLDDARDAVAALVSARPREVIFTAGATEANNTALRSVLRTPADPPPHVVTTAAEHPSVIEPLAAIEAEGGAVTRVPISPGGLVDPDAFEAAFTPATALVSLIWANNETGVIQPVREIAERAKARGISVHLDATQAAGKIPVDLAAVPADFLSLSAHKLNGPKGVGALIVRGSADVTPWIRGGPQERRRRGGTENLPGAVGFAVACELAVRELPERVRRYAALRDRLLGGIVEKVPRVERNGSPEHVLPNTLNVRFEGTAGDILLEALDLEGVAASSGAACHSGSIEPSAVLSAMGLTPEQARASVRFSVGHGVDEGQIDHVLSILPELVERVRRSATS